MARLRHVALAFLLLPMTCGNKAESCTVFYVFDGELAIAGDNEDWADPNTQVWFVPKSAKTYAVVYFGFGKGIYPSSDVADQRLKISDGGITKINPIDLYGHPQQGMNDQGLFFGGAATEVIERVEFPDRKKGDGQQLVHQIMRHCATVEDALIIMRRHDISQVQGQWMFGDQSGAAIIVEAGNVIIRKRDRFLVMTNFLASRVEPAEITCPRYQAVSAGLSRESRNSSDLVRSMLQETSGKWTQYSTLFNCTHGTITVFRRRDFDNSVTLDVDGECAKGRRCVSIDRLFDQGITKS